MSSAVISHKFFNGSIMEESSLHLSNIICYLPRKDLRGYKMACIINTNIKAHNNDSAHEYDEFWIFIEGGKIKNPKVIAQINEYLRNNDARSYFFEGFVSAGNGRYFINWGS
jgi:hypothetical protein